MPITGGVVLQGCSFGGSTTPVLSSMQYVKPVPRARLLGSTGGWERVGSAFPTERFSQVALRGASLGILGGEQGVLSNADLRVNTAATASEVAGLNPTPAREPSFVGSLLFGGSNSLTAGLGRTEGRLAALAGLTGGQRAATFAAIEPVSPGVVTFSGVIAARVVTPCP